MMALIQFVFIVTALTFLVLERYGGRTAQLRPDVVEAERTEDR